MTTRKAFYLSAASLAVLSLSAPALAGPALQAAMLPTSRSTSINRPVTVFASMINGGDATAKACSISLRNSALPLTLSYQPMQADNVTPAGAPDTPFDLAPGAAQALVLPFTPSAPVPAGSVRLKYSCSDAAGNAVAAPVVDGVNALAFSASATEAPDVVTIAQTRTGDGYIRIPSAGGAEAMAVSAVNIGAANNGNASDADLIAMPDTGNAALPVTLFVCETDAATGACLSNPAPFVHTRLGSTPKTYTVFANADPDAGIPDFPDISRVYLRFYETTSPTVDVRGEGRGATGLAVTAPAPASAASQSSALPEGIWEARFNGAGGAYREGLLFISASGGLHGIVYGDPDGEHANNDNGHGDHNGDANDNDNDGDGNGDTDNDGDANNDNGHGDHNGDANDNDNDADGNGDNDNDGDGHDDNGDGDGHHDQGGDGPEQSGDSSARRFASASLLSGSISTDAANNWSASATVLDLGNGAGGISYQLGGTYNARNRLTGTYVPATASSVSAIGNGSLRAAFSRDYDRTVALSSLGGSFDFYNGRTDIGDLTVGSDGHFSGVYTAPGAAQACNVSGDFSSSSAQANLFTVRISLSNCAAAGSYSGAATVRREDDDQSRAVNPIIGMAMTDAGDAGLILDLFPKGQRPRRDN